MTQPLRGFLLVLTAVMAVTLACQKKEAPNEAPSGVTPTPTVTGLTVTGGTPTVGTTAQMTATAALSNGATQNVTSTATWRSSNNGIATVNATGLVAAVGSGAVDISATHQTSTATIRLTVPSPAPSTFSLTGRVTDATSGAPLAGADVRATAGANAGKSSRTDSSGRYSLDQLVAGSITLRADANHPAYVVLDRTTTLSGATQSDFALPRVGSTPAPSPSPSPSPGSGAFVDVNTDSKTCGCSQGTIRVSANGTSIGTTSCAPSVRTFNVAPGNITLRACDDLGCWSDRNLTLTSGQTFGWLLTCTSSVGGGSNATPGSIKKASW